MIISYTSFFSLNNISLPSIGPNIYLIVLYEKTLKNIRNLLNDSIQMLYESMCVFNQQLGFWGFGVLGFWAGPHSLVLTFSQPVASSFDPHLADQESFMALPTGPSSGSPNENVVGAGPFVLKSFVQGEKIVLVKNPKYWTQR